MSGNNASQRRGLLLVFLLSGFAGLIYQSIWSHYLGLFLGHAAYAQALVLTLFMGGMAVGAAWIAKAGTRWRNLIRGYAIVELLIGVLGLIFHTAFTGLVDVTYEVLIPAAGSASAISLLKWALAALLVLPQTILLGMTFPLMSGGLIRRNSGQDGSLLGGLYFTNSIGAAIGALVSAFLLIPAVGLPGTTMTAGLVNVLVAALAWWLSREAEPSSAATEVEAARHGESGHSGLLRFVLWGTALSGAASFIYEITWVRMLSMAVGSTMQAFELMLAAFIAGIALGGLWIRKRADRANDPLRLVGWMQVFMGLAALLSLVIYAHSFEWVGWLIRALARSDGGYALFNLGTATLAILIMLPAAFFAGTTLPLFTVALLRAGFGERAIGRVYAWNTMGSIFGVFLGIHVFIPGVGLKLALCAGAAMDLLLGLAFLRARADSGKAMARFALAGAMAAAGIGFALLKVPFDPGRLASGVFRHARSYIEDNEKVVFYRDGKTASISVVESTDGFRRIATNGKTDASIRMVGDRPAMADESTMTLLATLPLAMHPKPERVGVIGFGSGLTTHTLLGDPRVAQVDTVEIEAAMVQGARAFGPRVERAYNDPRSHIVIDDAKAYFAGQAKRYDLIVSEPSNPWISGIGALFSSEFYRFIPHRLNDDGLFVQWIQLYEINDQLVASVLDALTPAFGDYAAWLSNEADLILVATPAAKLPDMDYQRVLQGALGNELRRIGVEHPDQIALRKVADARLLRAIARMGGTRANSDYFPLLSIHAPAARFSGHEANTLAGLPLLKYPLLNALGIHASARAPMSALSPYPGEVEAQHAQAMAAYLLGEPLPSQALTLDARAALDQFTSLAAHCASDPHAVLVRLMELDQVVTPWLPSQQLLALWQRPELEACRVHDPIIDRAMAVLVATAQRDPAAMETAGLAWLMASRQDGGEGFKSFDETALITVMLADAMRKDWASVVAREKTLGMDITPSAAGGNVRSLLLALADE